QQLGHRGLEVVVADGAARDAGRARAGGALVEDQNVLAAAEPTGPQFAGEVPGRGEPVDACSDDHIPAVRGDHGPAFQIPGGWKPSVSMPKSWPTDTKRVKQVRPEDRCHVADGMLDGHRPRPRPPGSSPCCRQSMRTGSPSASW